MRTINEIVKAILSSKYNSGWVHCVTEPGHDWVWCPNRRPMRPGAHGDIYANVRLDFVTDGTVHSVYCEDANLRTVIARKLAKDPRCSSITTR